MAFSELLSTMAMLLLMVFPGFIFKRMKLINQDQTKCISNIIVNLIVPAILIEALQREYTEALAKEVVSLAALWGTMFAIGLIIWLIWTKVGKLGKIRSGIFASILLVPNTGFVGIPLIKAFFGAEGLFYISLFEIISDIFVFTIVFTILNRSVGSKEKMKIREFFNPPIVAVIIGYTLFVLRIELPPFIMGAVKNISSASTALAMFVLGSQLADIKGKEFFSDISVYPKVAARLILMPVIAFVITRVILKDTSLMSTIFVLSWGLPAGVFCVIFSEKLGTDPEFATKCVMISNIFCLITTSVWVLLL